MTGLRIWLFLRFDLFWRWFWLVVFLCLFHGRVDVEVVEWKEALREALLVVEDELDRRFMFMED